jgi:argininosuccinate lyase
MSEEKGYIKIGKMTHVPKEQKDRGHGWFYRRAGIGRLLEDVEPFDVYKPNIPEFYGYHLFDLVHVVMLTEEGIIPKEIGIQLLKVLKEMEKEGIDKVRRKAGGGSHSGEAYLIQKLGWDIGGYIHAGRSSNDLAPTYRRIHLRDLLLDVADALNDLRKTLLDLAEANVNTIIPGETGLQHARPITLGFHLESLVIPLERDFERFELTYKHINTSTMGSTDGSGSDFPLNFKRTAELAGFDRIFDNGWDNGQGWRLDIELEVLTLLEMITNVTASIGGTLRLWVSQEFGMADLADRYCGTSSIMSQKKNPGVRRLISAAADVRACRISSDYANAVRATINSLKYAEGILKTTTWNKNRMRELCEYGFMSNASLSRILVQENKLPWRTAHQITAIMTRRALEKGMEMRDVTPEFLDECAKEYIGYGMPLHLSKEKLKVASNIENNVSDQKTIGGTAPERVMDQIANSLERLRQDRKSVEEKRDKLTTATQKLDSIIKDLI